MKKPILSIIVPIYNVEAYLPACMDSILQQTFTDFELILVDDGSPDSCGEMCDEYAKKDNRIVVIHKKNGGVSSARNMGLDVAKGDYITFADPDDEYGATTTIEENIQILLEDDSVDIVQFPIVYIQSNGDMFMKYKPQDKVILIGEERYLKHLFLDITSYHVWNKIYKRFLFDSHRFPNQITAEDIDFNLQISEYVQKMVLNSSSFYNYYTREESLTHNKNTERRRLINDIEIVILMCRKIVKYKSLSKSYVTKYSQWLSFCHKMGKRLDIADVMVVYYSVRPPLRYLLGNIFSQPKAVAYIAVHLLFKNNKKVLDYFLKIITKNIA